MIPLEETSDADFERHAFAILRRELGLDGLARFLRIYRSGTGDYTRDRHRWLEGARIQEVMARNRAPGQARRLIGPYFRSSLLAAAFRRFSTPGSCFSINAHAWGCLSYAC
jgi:hypothetical protein